MRYAHSVAAVREAEARAQTDLMAQAAFAIASRAADLLIDLHGTVYGSRVLLLVGPGSNGGDALFAGAHLAKRGASVLAWLSDKKFHQEAMAAFLAAGGRTTEGIEQADLIIDGIVGMGSKGEVSQLPQLPEAFILAIDLPSGVIPDSGEVPGRHVIADLTLATGAYKAAHFVDPAHDACGVVELIDLNLSFDDVALCESWQRDDVASVFERFSVNPTTVDKYRRGVLGLCAGSTTYPGAGALCTEAAIASGVGMIRSFGDVVPEFPEVVAVDGQVQALVIGPGLTEFNIANELLQRAVPAVIDAGAIVHHHAGRADTVLTPHAGELARYLEVDRAWVEGHRLQAVREATKKSDAVVVLKGSTTLIASPDGRCAINPTGTAALATAGSGDVLAGIIGGLMAQGAAPFEAAAAGAWIHGVAGSFAEGGASAIAAMVSAAIASVREY